MRPPPAPGVRAKGPERVQRAVSVLTPVMACLVVTPGDSVVSQAASSATLKVGISPRGARNRMYPNRVVSDNMNVGGERSPYDALDLGSGETRPNGIMQFWPLVAVRLIINQTTARLTITSAMRLVAGNRYLSRGGRYVVTNIPAWREEGCTVV